MKISLAKRLTNKGCIRSSTLVVVSASLLFSLGLLLQVYPVTIIPDEGYIFYRDWQYIVNSYSLASLCYSAAMSAVIIALPRFLRNKKMLLKVFVMLGATFALNFFVYNPMFHGWTLRVAGFNMEKGLINPFFNKGMEMDSLSKYPRQHHDFASKGYFNAVLGERRLTTYPPGLPMLHHAIKKIVSKSSAVSSAGNFLAGDEIEEIDDSTSPETKACCVFSALLYMLSACTIPVFVYLICLALGSREEMSLRIAALGALMPSLHLYASSEGVIVAPMALMTTLLVLAGIKRESGLVFYLGGLCAGAAMFFSYAMLPVIFLCCIVIAMWIMRGKPERQWKALPCWIAGGATAIIAGFLLDYNALEMLFLALANNRSFYSGGGRTYLISILANMSETALFMGPLLLFLVVLAETRAACKMFSMSRLSTEDGEQIIPTSSIYAAAAGLTLIVLILSGGVRGEVGRNLLPIFTLSLVCIPGAPCAAAKSFYPVATATAIHLLTTSLMFELIYGFWV
ncbi:MAG: hypothetical protein JW808_03910 [Victivallales bacterium]|nr:hypothetical protein [Victivallales bacterium]